MDNDFSLPQQYLESACEVSFDWLLGNTKTVTKIFAMQALFLLGFEIDWIHPE
ncbi:hypothetical protein [Zunongwangia sp. HGR-M22]|uniref:hypothetical protein n=1 Tax=Zunongwangia sp. HGR-M22 TaxID=3015168 RepID=UPI0022DE47D0|nr:hypothetical protein [Zunongwangia sp. HGR-M22]WBL27217.1 hypothetical protein PBT91_08055 [Zunongwangia sp. HGR-M22]